MLAPLAYALIMVGLAWLLLARPGGLLLTAAAFACAALLYWVIDPKLRAVSREYERNQARYLETLERRTAVGGVPMEGSPGNAGTGL